jgi:NDP-sugar pyrophosphorylase family protein
MSVSPHEFFDLTGFTHAALFADAEHVWQALDRLEAYLESYEDWRALGEVSPHAVVTGKVFIGEGTIVEPYAVVNGPCIIGAGCEVRQGAYLRGKVIAGDGCVIGHCSEVKSSILLDGAKAPHFNYVGDSVIGNGANLGAGTVCANLRLDGREICVNTEGMKVATGRHKLGAIIGDRARTGCNAVLNPGTLLARESSIGVRRAALIEMESGVCEVGDRTPDFSHTPVIGQTALRGYSRP